MSDQRAADREDQRTLGQHSARLDALERQIEKIDHNVETLLEQMNEARGGWKSMMALAGLASSAGAAFTWMVQHLWPTIK